MDINEITINSNPMAKPRMTRSDRWKKRPCVVKYFIYSGHIKWLIKSKNYVPSNELVMCFKKMVRLWVDYNKKLV